MTKGEKPMYVIYMGKEYDGYYKGNSPYRPVSREKAEKLTHKEANKIQGKLRRLGYKQSLMELA